MLSQRANELHARIELQDARYVQALTNGAHPKLLTRIHGVRCDLAREWGAQILADQFEAVAQ